MNYEEIREKVYQFADRAVQEMNNSETVQSLTPARVDNYLSLISGYSAMLEEELGNLEIEKAKWWQENRERLKSNIDTDRTWEGTTNGLRYIKLARLLKGSDKVIAACKARLRRLENEALNRY